MPRNGYRVMSIKEETYLKFISAAEEARKIFPDMSNSRFLELLLEVRKKPRSTK